MGIGDWGLGIGDWAQSPIPNPQSPIPIPMIIIINKCIIVYKLIRIRINYSTNLLLLPFLIHTRL